jgi:uncharacterized membrane protein YdcZ (DUF606 family)
MSKIFEDKDGNTSSKRIAGFIISGVGLIALLTLGIVSIFQKIEDPATAMESFKTILIVGGGLLGVGVFEFLGKK